ncbi:MAG TPA: hypothetical protein VHM19_14765, partial [Polyangiales bacterium]|nr:hypothetical protein [Polyangiales bacterium]
PDQAPRPQGFAFVESRRLPLRVHAPVGTPALQLMAALSALEDAYDELAARGWPLPFPDGGYGGSLAFDLYLRSDARHAAYAETDVPVSWVDFDSAQTYAVVDAQLSRRDLPACVLSALVQAALHGRDPAEAESVLRATGDLAAWLFRGEPGCADSMLDAQRAPERGLITQDPETGALGSLFLAMLAERHDHGTGHFMEALWELTQQRSTSLVKPDQLRSSPDLWEALATALQAAGESWEDDVEELAAARWFTGSARARAAASYEVMRAMPDGVSPPVLATWDYAQLPKRSIAAGDGLSELGSAYAVVHTPHAADGGGLKVWLRGELGPRWSLIAIRVGEDGHEVGRVKAPLRRVPESFLPVLLTSDTAEVVLAVSYLPAKTPDADTPPLIPRNFELVVDKGDGP